MAEPWTVPLPPANVVAGDQGHVAAHNALSEAIAELRTRVAALEPDVVVEP